MRSIKAILLLAGLVLASCSTGSAVRPSAAHDIDALAARAVRDANPQARWRAILMLAETDAPRVAAALRPALDDPNTAIRWNAAIALSFFGAAEAVPPLNAAVLSAEPLRRWEAINALGRVWDDQSVKRLAIALRSPSVRDRNEVVLTLGRIGGRAVEILIGALADESPQVRWRTAMALGRTRDSHALPALRAVAGGDPDRQVRDQARKAVARIESGR